MRITQQLLRSKASSPLQSVEYLDLSCLGITHIERLNSCPKLQALNVRGNSIVEISNLEQNRHLWRLDLSNNEIKDVDCLTKFIALGTLNLANNDVSWHELGKLRHLHVLELSLHGNKQLEKDPYYRIHVIDNLPHVWMLDGRIITSSERLQVKHFFADSAMTEHPVRRKLSKEWFVPTPLKKIEVNGVYGEKATHVMIRFPASGPSNIDTDRRRLKYLAHNVQEDLVLEKKYTKRDFQVIKYRKTFVEDILEIRTSDRERCNMLLLLLVATLEFVMPTHLVKETLETAKLSRIGKVYAMDLFLLPKDVRCRIVCIMLAAVKIDKDCKEDGGLYDKLYLCLFYTVAELSKLSNSVFGKNNQPSVKMNQLYRDYKCLLASEIVQLLCIVPAFFEYINKDAGVMNLVVTATGDTMIPEKVSKLSNNVLSAGGDVKKLYEELSDFLLQKVQDQSLNLTNKAYKITQEELITTSMKTIPRNSPHSLLDAAEFHAKGITSPNLDPPTVMSARRAALKNRKHFPHLGDYLLLGPQTLGKIIGLPQPFVAHVAMDSIPVANGAMESKLKQSEDHYTYVNMDQFDWDLELNFWKPRGSIGDKFTIHTIEDLRRELNRRANLTGDHLPRPNSPEDLGRALSMTPGRDSGTPLIFSQGGPQSVQEELILRKPRQSSSEFSPRPMTSLLKEKLDLKLDMTSRRVQSAGPTANRSTASPASPRCSPESKAASMMEHGGTKHIEHDEHVEHNQVEGQSGEPADCVHCAIAAAMAKDSDTENKGQQDHKHEHTTADTQQTLNGQGEVTNTETGPKEADKENVQPPDTVQTDNSLVHSDDEPELRNLTTDRSERPVSAPSPRKGVTQNKPDQKEPVKCSSSLQINIPQVELMDGDGGDDRSARKGRAPVIKGRQPNMSARSTVNPGKLAIQTKNRPFSAMDAYRYIVTHPRKPNENMFNTSYQEQRMEAWRQSASHSASQSHSPRQGTPPPQRPTSPDSKGRPKSSMSVMKANDWLGGGRDLYWESLQKRPRSGHVPGWKEGLPESMKRPRSAASRSMNRTPRKSHPVTPSSLAYEAMLQGFAIVELQQRRLYKEKELDRTRERLRRVEERDRQIAKGRRVEERDRQSSKGMRMEERDRQKGQDRRVEERDRQRGQSGRVKERDRQRGQDRRVEERDRQRRQSGRVEERDRQRGQDRRVEERDRQRGQSGRVEERDRQRGQDRRVEDRDRQRGQSGRVEERDRQRGQDRRVEDRDRQRGQDRRVEERDRQRGQSGRMEERDRQRGQDRIVEDRDRQKGQDRRVEERDRQRGQSGRVEERDRQRGQDRRVEDRDRQRGQDRRVEERDRQRGQNGRVEERDRQRGQDRGVEKRDRQRGQSGRVEERDRQRGQDRQLEERDRQRGQSGRVDKRARQRDQGGRGLSPRSCFDPHLPDMMDLNDYQPLYHNLGLPRRLGSAGSSGSHERNGKPTQDTVYRMPPSTPKRVKSPVTPQQSQRSRSTLNFPYIYQHAIHEETSSSEMDET